MPRRFSRRLVIDASIARSSGEEDAVFPTSIRCRECLKAVFDHGHRLVMSDAIAEEWRRHESKFALRWRVAMQSRRRMVHLVAPIDDRFQARVERTAETEEQQAAIRKDLHLVVAARASDRRILSLDEKM